MILDGIDVFTEVVAAQSFSRAAQRLGMPTSTVSAKVARLEARLGVTLLHRTTRHLRVTQIGQAYYEKCVIALAQMAEAEQALTGQSDAPAGLLRISAAGDLAQAMLAPVITAYLARYPDVQVDLQITNRRVDLVSEGVDLAIRAGNLADSSLVARRFVKAHMALWAAPAYLERHGRPATAHDLRHHRIVRLNRAHDVQTLTDTTGETAAIDAASQLSCDDIQMVKTFVENGAGLGILPSFVGAASNCPLVPVLPALRGPITTLYFVYPAQKYVPPNLRAFIDLADSSVAS